MATVGLSRNRFDYFLREATWALGTRDRKEALARAAEQLTLPHLLLVPQRALAERGEREQLLPARLGEGVCLAHLLRGPLKVRLAGLVFFFDDRLAQV